MAEFVCGTHRALVYQLGGEVLVGELTPLSAVRWQRIRDDISQAYIRIPTYQCCELLGDLRSVFHELHILRNDEVVWQGPIARIEYGYSYVEVFAEDILFVPKRRLLEVGYIQTGGYDVVDRMHWLMRDQCFARYGDFWNMATPNHLHPVHGPDDPRTSRSVPAASTTIWEDFDRYAENSGTDYTVINRDIYYFDNGLKWLVIPPLDTDYISQFPRVVEYGNSLVTRYTLTNGQGAAATAIPPMGDWINIYGGPIDKMLTTTTGDDTTGIPEVPSAEQLAGWHTTALSHLAYPTPVGVVIGANTTLLPGAPWTIDHLVPGAWFEVTVTQLCRSFTGWQRLHEIVVSEDADQGDVVNFTSVDPPVNVSEP